MKISFKNLVKKLVGMQLMVEPMAITLFQLVREYQLEPVLCDLLELYERDEARHVALGVLHLPKLLEGMTRAEANAFGRKIGIKWPTASRLMQHGHLWRSSEPFA